MSVDTYTPYQCWCCERGETEIVTALSLVSRRGEGWANASQVSDLGKTIASAKGYDPGDFDGLYRFIEVTVAYRIFSTEDSDQHGVYTQVLTTEHSGDRVVAAEELIEKTETTESDTLPADPLYVDFTSVDFDSSDAVADTEVLPSEVAEFARDACLGAEWQLSQEVVKIEIGNYQSGFAQSASGAFAVVIRSRYVPGYQFETDAEPGAFTVTRTIDAELTIPFVVTVFQFDVATELVEEFGTESFTLVWQEVVYVGFYPSGVDLSDPDSPGWTDVEFDEAGDFYYSADIPALSADVWPLFVVT